MTSATLALVLLLAQADPADSWERRYADARRELVVGHFAECSRLFSALILDSPDHGRRARAADAASLCSSWAAGGYRLLPPSLGGTEEVGDGRRTLDELAVLYTTAVLYGVGSGAVLATWTEPDTPAGGILPALALAGGAVGAVAFLDHEGVFRYGVPQSAVSGLLIGFEEGLAWTLWNQARVVSVDEWRTRTVAGVWWAGATAGAIAGGALGSVYGATPGRASLMGSGALWTGLVFGMAAAALTDSGDRRDDNGWLAAAVGVNIGAIGGAYLGAEVSPSIARVRFIDLGGLAGGLTLGGLALALEGSHAQSPPILTATALGAGAGIALGWYLTRSMPQEQRRASADLVPFLAPIAHGAVAAVGGTF